VVLGCCASIQPSSHSPGNIQAEKSKHPSYPPSPQPPLVLSRPPRPVGAGLSHALNDTIAFYAKAKKGHKQQQPDRNKKKCSHCKKKGHEKSECRKLKKEQEEKDAANASDSESSSSSSCTGTASAKVAVATTAPKDDIVRLFRAVATPSFPHDEPSDLSRSYTTTVPHPALKAQEELASQDLTEDWVMDSGASRTMCSHRDWFVRYSPLTSPINVALGDNSIAQATGVGHVPVSMRANGKWQPAVLQDVLHVPALHSNVLSVSQLAHRGAETRFVDQGCHILDQRKDLACEGKRRRNAYVMDIAATRSATARTANTEKHPDKGARPPVPTLIARGNTS